MKHLQRDLENLKKEILDMGTLVERAVVSAAEALLDGNRELAATVIRGDATIDTREIDVEEDCLKILALHQPVAGDLRFIVTVLKVNNDLERIGDLAQTMAKRAIALSPEDRTVLPQDLAEMVRRVRAMLSGSLDSLVTLDASRARKVLKDDEFVDDLHKKMYRKVREGLSEGSGKVAAHVTVLTISRCLERIADLSTNIAEDVVFSVEGEVIRHRGWEAGDDKGDDLD